MKFDFNRPLLNTKGEVQAENIGAQLAQLLGMSTGADNPVKFWGWAVKLDAGEPIELDSNEELMLMKFIKDNQSAYTILKAQLLNVMNEAAKGKE